MPPRRLLVRPTDEFLGIRELVRMGNARGVLCDAAVVGERCYRFSVLEARRTQVKPLRLEDGDTPLAVSSLGISSSSVMAQAPGLKER